MKTKHRSFRTMLWPKEKRARFHNRYCRFLMRKIAREGTGHTDFEGYDARRRLQLGLENMNESEA